MDGAKIFWQKFETEAGKGDTCEICPDHNHWDNTCEIQKCMRKTIDQVLKHLDDESDNSVIYNALCQAVDSEGIKRELGKMMGARHGLDIRSLSGLVDTECPLGTFLATPSSQDSTSLEERVWIQMREWLKLTIQGTGSNFFEPNEA